LEEHLSASGGKKRARIDLPLYDHISDIAALDEALTTLRYHRPQYGPQLTVKESRKLLENTPFTVRYAKLDRSRQNCTGEIAKLAEVLEHFMTLPLPSRLSDSASIDQYEALHDSLQKFWGNVRNEIIKRSQRGEFTPDEREEAISRVAEPLSAEHREQVQLELASLRKDVDIRGMVPTGKAHGLQS
jgi:hypothetical protein